MVKRRVAVVFGGASVEREVSRVSARTILAGLVGFVSSPFPSASTPRAVFATRRIRGSCSTRVSRRCPHRAGGDDPCLLFRDIDVAFPIVHGEAGEDGTLQGFFETIGLPYVGSGVAASALGMNKIAFKARMREAGIPVVRSFALSKQEWVEVGAGPRRFSREEVFASGVREAVQRRLVARHFESEGLERSSRRRPRSRSSTTSPPRGGGHRRARDRNRGPGKRRAPRLRDAPRSSPAGSSTTTRTSTSPSAARLLVPAPLDEATALVVRRTAVRAFVLCGCSGLARVDFFLDRKTGALVLNELNTLPGFTSISLYPEALGACRSLPAGTSSIVSCASASSDSTPAGKQRAGAAVRRRSADGRDLFDRRRHAPAGVLIQAPSWSKPAFPCVDTRSGRS